MSGEQKQDGGEEAGGPSFAELLDGHAPPQAFEVGQTVSGVVIQIGAEDVFLDLGGKGEGHIARAELVDDTGALTVAVGDTVEATVVDVARELRVSRRLLAGAHAREMLRSAAEGGIPVQGKVAGVVKGGFEVTVAGLRAFCPLSQMDLRRVEDQAAYLNQVYDFRVVELSEDGRRIVLSRRRLLEEEARRQAEETRSRIVPGAVLTGHVSTLTAFGAFVDLGGVTGLVHVSEISHQRIERPAEVLQPGQQVTVKVLKVDPQTGKVALSMKELEGDPWADVRARLRPRQVVEGRLARVAEFGAFVELLPGVDGLVHVSELPHGALGALREAAKQRAVVSVVVLEIDEGKRRIALALAPSGIAAGDVLEATSTTVGSVVTGKVESVQPFGVTLRLGPGQTGVIPNSEMGTPRGTDHGKEFPPGTEIAAEVISVDKGGRRIRLSRQRALAREERAEVERHTRTAQRASLSTFGDLLAKAQRERRR
ncbi:MAG: S1 RNA-binding domain-containing protein [Thermodesulfobacteriota bacterium]